MKFAVLISQDTGEQIGCAHGFKSKEELPHPPEGCAWKPVPSSRHVISVEDGEATVVERTPKDRPVIVAPATIEGISTQAEAICYIRSRSIEDVLAEVLVKLSATE